LESESFSELYLGLRAACVREIGRAKSFQREGDYRKCLTVPCKWDDNTVTKAVRGNEGHRGR
jgi:hypothetical protein